MVGLRITLCVALFALAAGCSRDIRETNLQCRFSGQRGRYDYVLSLRPLPGFDPGACTVAAYTTWPRPNQPYDADELHSFALKWEPGAQAGWRQACFNAQPPVKELVLVYADSSGRLQTYRISAPQPGIDLAKPEMY